MLQMPAKNCPKASGFISLTLVVGLCLGLGGAFFEAYRRYGGATPFPSQPRNSLRDPSTLEVVAKLPLPPGNLAISGEGEVFFTFHPEAKPSVKVARLHKNGGFEPFPDASWQKPRGEGEAYFEDPLSLRFGPNGWLWTLDLAKHGFRQPRLLAFDVETGELKHRFDFPAILAGLGSHLNDFKISPDGRKIYIADASPVGQNPALIVYDVEKARARRFLDGHPAVAIPPYYDVVQGRHMVFGGFFAVRPGVDSIALDGAGRWLYFSAMTSPTLYRIDTEYLAVDRDDDEDTGLHVEEFATKPATDGILWVQDTLWFTDPDLSSIHKFDLEKRDWETVVATDDLRWPDGLSSHGGYLYLTTSALHQVILKSKAEILEKAPFLIYRLPLE